MIPIIAPNTKYYHAELLHTYKFTTYALNNANSYNSSGTLDCGYYNVTNIQDKIMYATALKISLVGNINAANIDNQGDKIDVSIAMDIQGIGGTTTISQILLDENSAYLAGSVVFNELTFPGIMLPMKSTYNYGDSLTTINTNGGSFNMSLYYSANSSNAFRHIYVTAPASTLTLQITAIY